jgi:hypothetical protein
MNLNRKELRELTADVTNPHHDRRKRYGQAAIKTVQAGKRFVHTLLNPVDVIGGLTEEQAAAVGMLPGALQFTDRDDTITDPDFRTALLQNSKVVELVNWSDINRLHGGGADDVLDLLLKQGAITVPQLVRAVETIEADWAKK